MPLRQLTFMYQKIQQKANSARYFLEHEKELTQTNNKHRIRIKEARNSKKEYENKLSECKIYQISEKKRIKREIQCIKNEINHYNRLLTKFNEEEQNAIDYKINYIQKNKIFL